MESTKSIAHFKQVFEYKNCWPGDARRAPPGLVLSSRLRGLLCGLWGLPSSESAVPLPFRLSRRLRLPAPRTTRHPERRTPAWEHAGRGVSGARSNGTSPTGHQASPLGELHSRRERFPGLAAGSPLPVLPNRQQGLSRPSLQALPVGITHQPHESSAGGPQEPHEDLSEQGEGTRDHLARSCLLP